MYESSHKYPVRTYFSLLLEYIVTVLTSGFIRTSVLKFKKKNEKMKKIYIDQVEVRKGKSEVTAKGQLDGL